MPEVIDVELVNVTKRFGSVVAVDNVSFQVPRGSFFSILGPSGSGKTTTLRMIAGFEEPDEGDVFIAGQRVNGIPPNRRPTNMVFQQLALFPLMSVFDNVAFGLKMARVPRQEIKERVERILEKVGLAGLGNRKPDQLSGGQQQRVAIARCLVLEPTVLLLDEPLGALDLKLREQMKIQLKHLQEEVGTTFIYITHDQSEALVMSDYVAVMNEGKIQQIGRPDELYSNPANPFVAGFVGESNQFQGTIVEIKGDHAVMQAGPFELKTPLHPEMVAGKSFLNFVRPEKVRLLSPEASVDEGEPTNLLRGVIKEVIFDGAVVHCAVDVGHGRLINVMLTRTSDIPLPREGESAQVAWAAGDVHCYPA